MDSITHIVLGATIGELVAGRRLGKQAMLLGAIAQSLPDIDFVASFWSDTAHDVLGASRLYPFHSIRADCGAVAGPGGQAKMA